MPARSPILGPLLLQGSLHETIWGGQRLATIAGKTLPAGAAIGESWETATESVVREGPLAGMRLGQLVDRYEADLIGSRAAEVYGMRFPLLAKFLDANQKLSVQVHPDDTYAAAHEHGKLGKTETWFILHAEPDAQLVYGLARPTSAREVRAAIAANTLEALLNHIPARAGQVIFVPAGTVHAICGGVALYELQEYSDVTYRLYDYGRRQADGTLRDLHIEQSLDVMRFDTAAPAEVKPLRLELPSSVSGGEWCALVACRYFLEEELRFAGSISTTTSPASCVILTVLDGGCALSSSAPTVALTRGDTVVLPASLGEYTLTAAGVRLIRSSVPCEDDETAQRWRREQ
ncbi:MAG TPA: type I phosphomannose isomerase catalytic subunit [Ktedonobacterales bacterium]|nr:type I phosphomannose isomerase catalytic subunit [Ktedonobacterales bacterium]